MNARSLLFLALTAAAPALAEGPAPSVPSSSPSSETAAAVPGASAPLRLTLEEALRKALADNPTLGRSRIEVDALQSQADVAFSSILPRIVLQGSFTRNDQEVAFGEGEDSRTILAENDWSYRLTLSQPVFAGNRERKAITQARLNVDVARQVVADTEEELILGVAASYLAVVQAEELLAVEERNLELARRRRDQAQIFFEVFLRRRGACRSPLWRPDEHSGRPTSRLVAERRGADGIEAAAGQRERDPRDHRNVDPEPDRLRER